VSGRPKALVPLCGRPMLEYSVAALQAVPAVSQIIVALPADELDNAPAGTVAVSGGAQRSHSVRNALAACGDDDVVIVHDAARPLASVALFQEVVKAVRVGADGAVPGIPVADTVKVVDDGRVVETLDRARLGAVQTPQAFAAGMLRRAHEDAAEGTDCAALVEAAGGRVVVVPGEEANAKITSQHDLLVARSLIDDLA